MANLNGHEFNPFPVHDFISNHIISLVTSKMMVAPYASFPLKNFLLVSAEISTTSCYSHFKRNEELEMGTSAG
jgi:hypothetical protein